MLLCSSFHMMSVGHIPVPGAWHLSVSRAARPATPPEKPTRSMLSSWSRACHPAPCPNLSSQLNASTCHRQASPGLHILLSLLALEQPSEISGHTPDPGRPCPWVPPLCSPPVPTSWLVVCLCGPQAHSNRRPPPPGTWGITYIFLPRLCLGFQHFSGRKDRQVCPRESSGNGACVPPPLTGSEGAPPPRRWADKHGLLRGPGAALGSIVTGPLYSQQVQDALDPNPSPGVCQPRASLGRQEAPREAEDKD